MIVAHEKDIKALPSASPDAKGAFMKAIVSPKEGWEGYVMRVVELDPEGYSPRHSHDWPHINYCLEGEGVVFIDGKEYELVEGGYAYIPNNKLHQFINKSKDKKMRFICIVPEVGHY